MAGRSQQLETLHALSPIYDFSLFIHVWFLDLALFVRGLTEESFAPKLTLKIGVAWTHTRIWSFMCTIALLIYAIER